MTAVVTGASGGIGRAIAVCLARNGAAVCAVGRNPTTLGETVAEAQLHSRALPFQADLAVDASIGRLGQLVTREFGRLDVLVHCAGIIFHNPMRSARIEDFDNQYAINIRAPYLLTQSLLPMLTSSHGQIVFIDSSLGISAKQPEVGQFAATQHAMKAVAESLRQEVNPEGVRILTVYPGRTASPRMKALYEKQGAPYRPELLMQPQDVAAMVISALTLPRTAEVTDISMRPMLKSY
jgi:NAD(P)-dependent dehydrogenase (short-subunit alcohol dehydrogenase family)